MYATEDDQPVKLLLALSVFEGEQSFGSEAHRILLEATLQQYNKSMGSLLFITADNCSTNKSLVYIIGVPMIGCFSHRLNLAVQKYCDADFSISASLSKIRELMIFLRTSKGRGWLRQYTLRTNTRQ